MSPLNKGTANGTDKVTLPAHGTKQENRPAFVKMIKSKTPRLVNQKILAERNQVVVPVGVWVESGMDCQEHPAILALLTEEQQVALSREKEESLRKFQHEVQRRVAQQARVRKRQQLEKSSKTVEREGRVLLQFGNAAQPLTPGKCMFSALPQGELAICSPGSHLASTRGLSPRTGDARTLARPEGQPAHQLSQVMRQVRRRLGSYQSVPVGEAVSELPGGNWKVSPSRDRSASHRLFTTEEVNEEIPLIGQHDQPLGPADGSGKTVTFQDLPVCDRPFREPYPSGPSPRFDTDYRASQVLWPEEDREELKKQRQSQFTMYRRLFMDIEREQVKELHRQRKQTKRIARIKAVKEQQRVEEERQMLRSQELDREEVTEREWKVLERLRLEEDEMLVKMERKERARKNREAARFVEALRAQTKERMAQGKVELPPLCCCGESFWDAHPETCANNCVFYNNPKAYAQALQSVLLSSGLREGNLSHRASARKIASVHEFSPRK